MWLQLAHPAIAARSCEHCLKYQYDERTGEPESSRKKDGSFRLRIAECPAPCRAPGKGCPKGTPEQSKALNERNRDCYEHYLECKATGQFPDDSVVRRNAGVIRETEERYAEIERSKFERAVILAANLGTG